MKPTKTEKLLALMVGLQASQLALLSTDAKTPALGQMAAQAADEAMDTMIEIMGTKEGK